jgi:hypothetical protein
MSHRVWTRGVVCLFAAAVIPLLMPSGASALTLKVDCNKGKTISGALAMLTALGPVGTAGPNKVLVSGTCNENVTINGMANLTLEGTPSATINGNANGNGVTLWMTESQNITVNNFTINGFGVYCAASSCLMNNDTVQNSDGNGVAVGVSASMILNTSTVQNNAGAGVAIRVGGNVALDGSTVQGNAGGGVTLEAGGILTVTEQSQGFNITGPAGTTIQNNALDGIFADVNSTLRIELGVNITGNARDGIRLEGGSKALLSNVNISGNTGHGLRIGDLSFAEFAGQNTITGNNLGTGTPLDVVCDPKFSATRGIGTLTGTATNCPAEPPMNP